MNTNFGCLELVLLRIGPNAFWGVLKILFFNINLQTIVKSAMSTLSNVKTRRGGTNPLDAGLTSNVLSEAGQTATGVSVKNAQT